MSKKRWRPSKWEKKWYFKFFDKNLDQTSNFSLHTNFLSKNESCKRHCDKLSLHLCVQKWCWSLFHTHFLHPYDFLAKVHDKIKNGDKFVIRGYQFITFYSESKHSAENLEKNLKSICFRNELLIALKSLFVGHQTHVLFIIFKMLKGP